MLGYECENTEEMLERLLLIHQSESKKLYLKGERILLDRILLLSPAIISQSTISHGQLKSRQYWSSGPYAV